MVPAAHGIRAAVERASRRDMQVGAAGAVPASAAAQTAGGGGSDIPARHQGQPAGAQGPCAPCVPAPPPGESYGKEYLLSPSCQEAVAARSCDAEISRLLVPRPALHCQRNVAASHSEPPMATPATPRRCSKAVKHPVQEHEVGLAALWLSQLGDGVTADLETSSRVGQFASVTAATALDSQRHAIGKLTHIETHHSAIRNTEVKGPTCACCRSSCRANASARTPAAAVAAGLIRRVSDCSVLAMAQAKPQCKAAPLRHPASSCSGATGAVQVLIGFS